MSEDKSSPDTKATPPSKADPATGKQMPREINGPRGPEPTRYGDWEKNGICSDF